jgi:hypothetical protein
MAFSTTGLVSRKIFPNKIHKEEEIIRWYRDFYIFDPFLLKYFNNNRVLNFFADLTLLVAPVRLAWQNNVVTPKAYLVTHVVRQRYLVTPARVGRPKRVRSAIFFRHGYY